MVNKVKEMVQCSMSSTVLTVIRIFNKFSSVGSWGTSFCTTLLKALQKKNNTINYLSSYMYHKNW